MSNRNRPSQYHHWTEVALQLGALYSLFWFAGVVLSWNALPWIQRRSLSPWWLLFPFVFPVLPSLGLTLALWRLARRAGYPTVGSALRGWLDTAVRRLLGGRTSALPPSRFVVGTTEDGRLLALERPFLDLHFLVDGKTRQGKSTLLATIAFQDASRADCAVLLLDPHAGLVDTLLAAGLADVAGDRLMVLLADQDHVPGLNLLQPLPGESPQDCAARLTETALALWFDARLTEAQRFQNYAFHAAWALAETGWTVLEVEPLLRHRPFRQAVAARVTDPALRQWLAELDRVREDHLRDLTESTVNRFRAFGRGTAALIFGQRRTTFDLPRLLDTGGVLLVSLPTAVLGDTGSYLAAGTLLSLVDVWLARRPKDSPHHRNPRVRLLADEAQAYAVPSLRRLLAERAGYGLSLVLATQGLNQLADRRLARFILNNVGVYFCFACGAEEARTLAEELFRPDPLLVKHRREPWVTFYSPHEQMDYWAREIQNLPAHAFFVRAPERDAVRGTTRPLPVRLDGAALASLRADLARRVGRPRGEVEAELARRRRWIYEGGAADPELLGREGSDGWI